MRERERLTECRREVESDRQTDGQMDRQTVTETCRESGSTCLGKAGTSHMPVSCQALLGISRLSVSTYHQGLKRTQNPLFQSFLDQDHLTRLENLEQSTGKGKVRTFHLIASRGARKNRCDPQGQGEQQAHLPADPEEIKDWDICEGLCLHVHTHTCMHMGKWGDEHGVGGKGPTHPPPAAHLSPDSCRYTSTPVGMWSVETWRPCALMEDRDSSHLSWAAKFLPLQMAATRARKGAQP